MLDASKDIRAASANALSTIVVMDDLGNVIAPEVWDGQAPPKSAFPRIILGSINGPSGNTRFSKCGFGGIWTQRIKVSMFYQADTTKNLVDDISNQVLSLLCPLSPPFLVLGLPFVVWNVDAVPGPHQEYTDGIGNYVDRDIIINYSITQN